MGRGTTGKLSKIFHSFFFFKVATSQLRMNCGVEIKVNYSRQHNKIFS